MFVTALNITDNVRLSPITAITNTGTSSDHCLVKTSVDIDLGNNWKNIKWKKKIIRDLKEINMQQFKEDLNDLDMKAVVQIFVEHWGG